MCTFHSGAPSYTQRDHYGYVSGRRLCPGIHLAERNLWLAMAKLLWAFEFGKMEGKPVDADHRTEYSEGSLCCSMPFEANIKVRGRKGETIEREFELVQSDVKGKYETG